MSFHMVHMYLALLEPLAGGFDEFPFWAEWMYGPNLLQLAYHALIIQIQLCSLYFRIGGVGQDGDYSLGFRPEGTHCAWASCNMARSAGFVFCGSAFNPSVRPFPMPH